MDKTRSRATLESLETLEGYRDLFYDPDYWRPYVQAVCRKHFQVEECRVQAVLPGTYPTFIADDRWVVKFFGRLFDGEASFEKELEISQLLKHGPQIPTHELVAHGSLLEKNDDWPWPYLIFKYVDGVSLGEVMDQLSLPERIAIAAQLGRIVRQFHSLSVSGSQIFAHSWQGYAEFLHLQAANCRSNHQTWGSLPPHLIDQVEDYLLPIEKLIDWRRQPHLIHADLTRDHLLGKWEGRKWQTLALIDFGDARVGDLLYELVALYLDLFTVDPRLLRVFLDAYGSDLAKDDEFPHRALSTALMHEFDVFGGLDQWYPAWKGIPTLTELADLVWKTGVTSH
jgi:hygromycin-B 7''-O-kinase